MSPRKQTFFEKARKMDGNNIKHWGKNGPY